MQLVPEGLWERVRPLLPGRPPRLRHVLLQELRAAGTLDLETTVVDGSHVRAQGGSAVAVAFRWSRPRAAATTTT